MISVTPYLFHLHLQLTLTLEYTSFKMEQTENIGTLPHFIPSTHFYFSHSSGGLC